MSLVSKYLKWKFGGRKWNKFDGNELNWEPPTGTNLWSWFYLGFLVVTPENTTLKQSVVALGVQQINFCWCLWFFIPVSVSGDDRFMGCWVVGHPEAFQDFLV